MSFKKVLFAFLSLVLVGGVLIGYGESPKPLPPPDLERIAADEARGIKFSEDKRTLVKYNKELSDEAYTIPFGVTTIGDEAFSECFNLMRVTIPAGVTAIGKCAFWGCGKVEVAPENPNFCNDAGGWLLIDRRNKKLLYAPIGLGAYTIPDGVTIIGEGAFAGCEELTRITIPSSVTTIEEGAFYGCPRLTSVTIPSSVKTIGEGAFKGCPCVESVKKQFPNYR